MNVQKQNNSYILTPQTTLERRVLEGILESFDDCVLGYTDEGQRLQNEFISDLFSQALALREKRLESVK